MIHLAAWGTRELVRFEWNGAQLSKRSVPLGFAGDNLRWSDDGKTLLVGGQKFVARKGGPASLDGWSVVRVHPDTLEAKMVRDAVAEGNPAGRDGRCRSGRRNLGGTVPRQPGRLLPPPVTVSITFRQQPDPRAG